MNEISEIEGWFPWQASDEVRVQRQTVECVRLDGLSTQRQQVQNNHNNNYHNNNHNDHHHNHNYYNNHYYSEGRSIFVPSQQLVVTILSTRLI